MKCKKCWKGSIREGELERNDIGKERLHIRLFETEILETLQSLMETSVTK